MRDGDVFEREWAHPDPGSSQVLPDPPGTITLSPVPWVWQGLLGTLCRAGRGGYFPDMASIMLEGNISSINEKKQSLGKQSLLQSIPVLLCL